MKVYQLPKQTCQHHQHGKRNVGKPMKRWSDRSRNQNGPIGSEPCSWW